MTASLSTPLSPSFGSASAAVLSLPNLTLSEDESRAFSWLIMRLFDQRPYLELRGLYYDGLQKMQDLGISIPPSLKGLRTIMGWPAIGIDAIDERCVVEGFRYPGATVADDDLWGIWQANNLDGEASLAQLDALIYGRCYITIGPGDDTTYGQPLITAESPINMTAMWDARMRRPTAALQLYLDTDFTSDMYGQEVAALYLPDRTVFMARTQPSESNAKSSDNWSVTDRDNHTLGRLPVVRMANRQRLTNREGLSEITAAWMNITDSACRTLLGMEVGREFFAAPRRYVLGAAEDAFQNPDGTAKSAWDTYMGKIWGLERDEDGNVPTVGEFKTGDPSTYTKLIDTYSKIAAGLMGLDPRHLGFTADSNPASADAMRSADARIVKRCERKMIGFGEAWEESLRIALMIKGAGQLPDGAERIETDWVDPNTPTPQQTSQAVTMQVNAGMLPRSSDVGLKKVGYTAVERALIAKERDADPGEEFLNDAASSEEAKAIIASSRLTKTVDPSATTPPPAASP